MKVAWELKLHLLTVHVHRQWYCNLSSSKTCCTRMRKIWERSCTSICLIAASSWVIWLCIVSWLTRMKLTSLVILSCKSKRYTCVWKATDMRISTRPKTECAHAHLEGLVGLCYGQNFMPMVNTSYFTKWAKQPLASAAVPLQSFLLMLCACEHLDSKETTDTIERKALLTANTKNYKRQTFGRKLLVGRMCSCWARGVPQGW